MRRHSGGARDGLSETVIIHRRFCGPPDSGNGGYSAGLLARALGGSGCEVTLLKPPPLGVALRIEREGDEARLMHGDEAVASTRRATLDLEVPAPPSLAEARAAERRFAGLTDHIFPGCFVCGPERAMGDGLRIFPGAADGAVASTWRPGADLAGEDGALQPEFIWAALDCPGYFAVQAKAGLALLGRMSAVRHAPLQPGRETVVTGWEIASEGRKHRVGTAIHDEDGKLIAAAQSTWITLR